MLKEKNAKQIISLNISTNLSFNSMQVTKIFYLVTLATWFFRVLSNLMQIHWCKNLLFSFSLLLSYSLSSYFSYFHAKVITFSIFVELNKLFNNNDYFNIFSRYSVCKFIYCTNASNVFILVPFSYFILLNFSIGCEKNRVETISNNLFLKSEATTTT